MLSIPSGQSTICLYHNLFLEGRGLGLLLYGDNFVMYGAICVCKRKYSEKHVWDFLWVWWKELGLSAQWEAPSHASPPESSRRDSHTRWSLDNLVLTMVLSLRQVVSSEPCPSISIKQIHCCPPKKPWLSPHPSYRAVCERSIVAKGGNGYILLSVIFSTYCLI